MVRLDNVRVNTLYSEKNSRLSGIEANLRYIAAKEVYHNSEPFRIVSISSDYETCDIIKLEEKQPIKSTGGSSSYYDLELPEWVIEKILNRKAEDGKYYIKTEECCEVFFGNDFDYSNLFKSSVRSYGTEQGEGKAGNTTHYEMTKVQYSADKIKELSERRNKE